MSFGIWIAVLAYVYDTSHCDTVATENSELVSCSWTAGTDSQDWFDTVLIDNHSTHWILIIQVSKNVANTRTNEFIEIHNLKVDS